MGGSSSLFPAPLCLLQVDLCWKWAQAASARASSTPTGISRGEELWQHGSVGGRWRDCASLWVENEAKCEARGNKIMNSFVGGGGEKQSPNRNTQKRKG